MFSTSVEKLYEIKHASILCLKSIWSPKVNLGRGCVSGRGRARARIRSRALNFLWSASACRAQLEIAVLRASCQPVVVWCRSSREDYPFLPLSTFLLSTTVLKRPLIQPEKLSRGSSHSWLFVWPSRPPGNLLDTLELLWTIIIKLWVYCITINFIPYFLVIRRISLISAYSLLSACYFVGLSTRY